MELSGGCLCGAVRLRAGAEPRWVVHCHCGMCRRQSGAAFTTWLTLDAGALAFERGAPTWYRSSPAAERGFCARCGSTLTFRYDASPELVDLAIGALDDPARIRATHHIWCESALPWALPEDGLPRLARSLFDPRSEAEPAGGDAGS